MRGSKRILKQTGAVLAALAALGAPAARAFDAQTVPDLELWLKADAGVLTNASGVVTNWQDQSGCSHHGVNSVAVSPVNPVFTNTAPQLNNRPALVFNGAETGITLGNLGSFFPTAATLFAVAAVDDTQYNLFITLDNSTYWRYSGNGMAYPGAFRQSRIESYAAMPSSGAHLFQIESTASTWRQFTNGVAHPLNTTAAYAGGNNYRIGYGQGAGGMTGQIAEILAFHRALDSNEMNRVAFYLADKYALATAYPLPTPQVSNASGATNVTASSAWLNGFLQFSGTGDSASVTVYYGTSDPGTNWASWDTNYPFGSQNDGTALSVQVQDLAPHTNYAYRFCATNASGEGWASPAATFITGDVTIHKTADASETGLTPGTFTVSRVSSAAAGPLTVYYAPHADSTAIAGVDYVALPGTLVIPDGAASATVVVTPLMNPERTTASTLKLELLPGPYLIGSPSNDTLTLDNIVFPDSITNAWVATAAGNASTAGNWSLGHAPTESETVLLDYFSTKDMTWDAAAVSNVAHWIQNPGYTGTVTFATVFGSTGFTNFTVSGDAMIAGGSWSHAANTTNELNGLFLTIGRNLTIEADGQIQADYKGYIKLKGPGASVGDASGGYGGMGSAASGATVAGTTYGSASRPVNLGSGGRDNPGAGAVRLTVGGATTVNGAISASNPNSINNTCAGSGGSVLLFTGTLGGTGVIRANGGPGASYAGNSGGGGRVALILSEGTDWGGVQLESRSYVGRASNTGAGGTIYVERPGDTPGQGLLIVDYQDVIPGVPSRTFTLQCGTGASSRVYSEIILTNGAQYGLDTNDTLNIAATLVRGDPADLNDGIRLSGGALTIPAAFAYSNYTIFLDITNASFAPASSLTLGTNAALRIDVPWTMNHPLTIEAGGWVDHSPNTSSELYKLNLTINGNLDVQPGGQFNVDGMGYSGGAGPGKPIKYDAGASYGGNGGRRTSDASIPGPTYGSITAPTNLGSAAHKSGGGAILLTVTATATVNGVLSANGLDDPSNFAGGSGGSVYLRAGYLAGSGTIRANGSTANWPQGGGGRVAVVLTNSTDFGNIQFESLTGAGNMKGAGGTVYLQHAGQGPGQGRLIVDWGNRVSAEAAIATQISSNVTDTVVGSVLITNKGILLVSEDQALTVNGDWINRATFIARSNGVVDLAGADPATVAGANAFDTLIGTNAGKILSFAAGSTTTVARLLRLGTFGRAPLVTLQSTAPGSPWFLQLAGDATQQIAKVRVQDSDARNGQTLIAAAGSVDAGENHNWQFLKAGGTVILIR